MPFSFQFPPPIFDLFLLRQDIISVKHDILLRVLQDRGKSLIHSFIVMVAVHIWCDFRQMHCGRREVQFMLYSVMLFICNIVPPVSKSNKHKQVIS